MKIYCTEVKLCATAYIMAENEEEARKIAEQNFGEGNDEELPEGEGIEISVSSMPFAHPDFPTVSIAPGVTFYGAFDGTWNMDLIEECKSN